MPRQKHRYHTIIKDTTKSIALAKAKNERKRWGIRARAVKNAQGKWDVEISVK